MNPNDTPHAQAGCTPDPGQPDYLTQRELSQRWKISIRTLERWRGERYGPAWHVLGNSVRYGMRDVLAYEAARRHGD